MGSALASIAAIAVLGYVVNVAYPLRDIIRHKPETGTHRVAEWTQLKTTGVLLGRENALVTIAEFSDFECPACAHVHTQLQELQRRFGDTVSISFHHYPLEALHPFARAAAMAAECARVQGRFHSMYDLLFTEQDSIGVRTWSSFAADAGVLDVPSFQHCLSEAGPSDRIDADHALGDRLGVTATPTLIVEGLTLLPGAPEQDTLVAMIHRIIALKATAQAVNSER